MTMTMAPVRETVTHSHRSATHNTQPVAGLPMTRNFEVAARRADGKMHISQHKAPAIPLFDDAFFAFSRGSLIPTPNGKIAIEDLQPGDELITSTGEVAPVLWIGTTSFVPADPKRRLPLTRIMADTFGPGRPLSFLTVGPSGRIAQTPEHLRGGTHEKGMLSLASDSVDGLNIIEICPPTAIRMFHICLEKHATIDVGGIEMESFHPGPDALKNVSGAMQALFFSMFPHIASIEDFGPLVRPRAPAATAAPAN